MMRANSAMTLLFALSFGLACVGPEPSRGQTSRNKPGPVNVNACIAIESIGDTVLTQNTGDRKSVV